MNLWNRIKQTIFGAHPSNPDRMILSAFNLLGDDSATGIHVTPQNALTYSAVYACQFYLSMDVGKLPLHTFKRTSAGRDRAPEMPLYTLLHDAPNPEMTSITFRSALQGHLLGWGNAYANIVRDGAGRVIELWPLRPDRILGPYRNESGRLYYLYRAPVPHSNGEYQEQTLFREEVLHIPGFSPDGQKGHNVISLSANSIALGMATEKHGGTFFGNGAKPGGIITYPGKLSKETLERARKNWNEQHQGLDRAHRMAILEEGMTFKEVGVAPEAAQLLQTREFQIAEVARWYRMPLQKLGVHDKAATYASAEQFAQDYVDDTMTPWCVIWEQNIALQLMTKAERRHFFVKHNLNALLRGDTKSRGEFYTKMFNIGAYSINMILEREDENTIGPEGDVHYVPLNMEPAEVAMKRQPAAPKQLQPPKEVTDDE